MKITPLSAIFLSTLAVTIAAEPVRFIPATPENTMLFDGSALNLKEGDWKWLPDEGNHGILESHGDPKKNAPALIIHAKGLEPGRDYEVFGFFWTHGFGQAPPSRGRQPHHWPARFGTGLATLTTYGGKVHPNVPWIICPESKAGIHFGYTATLEENNPLVKDVAGWTTAVDDLRLIRARTGISRADKQGTLPVYADDFPDSSFCGHTRIDGIGIRLLPAGDHDSTGAGKPGHLHLAVRAGDHLNMRRELDAGADVNALDEDGVTPLLYPATSGDQAMVRELLKAGANPNQPGQTILPLTGACSWGDTDMVKLLLETGAEVPPQVPEKSPLLDPDFDPARLHPAIAAIRAGSLSCLKLLLDNRPELNLAGLEPRMPKEMRSHYWPTPDKMVDDAILSGQDDLAAFLVARGCPIPNPEIIAKSVGYGEAMRNTTEALLRRGIPAVQEPPFNRYSGRYVNEHFVQPWDALSAAVAIGNLALTERFLADARSVNERYLMDLYALADTCRNPLVEAAIRAKFPNRPKQETAEMPVKDEGSRMNASAFLPRKGKPKVRPSDHPGKLALAVIPAPGAADQAALLEAKAATADQWNVVDRELITAAFRENNTAKPWIEGTHRMADLGDQLSADVIVVVSKVDGTGIALYRFETIDVRTGLALERQYADETLLAGNDSDAFLERMHTAARKARGSEHPAAVSLLSFTAADGIPMSRSLAPRFKALVEIEVDQTPGLIAVGLREIESIVREQNLGGEGSFLGAACTVEGGINPLPDGRIAVTLRLRNLAQDRDHTKDITMEGTTNELDALISRAWLGLLKNIDVSPPDGRNPEAQAKMRKLEAERLAREAGWLGTIGKHAEVRPIAERALALGADGERIVPLLMSSHIAQLPFVRGNPYAGGILNYTPPIDSAPCYRYQSSLIEHLDELQAMLDSTESLHLVYGKECLHWRSNPLVFWRTLHALCYARSIMPISRLSEKQKDVYEEFGDNLDAVVHRFFRSLPEAYRKGDNLGFTNSFFPGRMVSVILLRANPTLAEAMCDFYLECLRMGQMPMQGFLNVPKNPDAYLALKQIFQEMEKREKLDSKTEKLLSMQAELAHSSGDKIPLLLRDHQRSLISMGRRHRQDRRSSVYQRLDDASHGISRYFLGTASGLPNHAHIVLHGLFHEPRIAPDCFVRDGYQDVNRFAFGSSIASLESSGNPARTHGYLNQEFVQYPRSKMNEFLESKEMIAITTRRIEACRIYDLLLGLQCHEPLQNDWRKLSAGGLDPAGIKPAIFLDLTRNIASDPGLIDLHVQDSTNPNRIWLRYRTFKDGVGPSDQGGWVSDKIKPLDTWLLGIDCTKGVVEVAINLSKCADLKDKHSEGFSLVANGSAFISQTSNTLLTSAEWRAEGGSPSAYAIIDKKSGKIGPVLNKLYFREFSGYLRHQAVCVEAVGNSYYALASDDPSRSYGSKPARLVRIEENGRVEYLTEPGRRPEMTPFDSEDRAPEAMTPVDNCLLVYLRNNGGYSSYDPMRNIWEPFESDQKKTSNMVYMKSKTAFERVTAHQRRMDLPGMRNPVRVRWDDAMWGGMRFFPPMMFEVDVPGKGKWKIPVTVDLPEAYRERSSFGEHAIMKNNVKVPERFFTAAELVLQKRVHPVVFWQSDTELVVGMRIKPMNDSSGAIFAHLPMLWKISKDDMSAFINRNAR